MTVSLADLVAAAASQRGAALVAPSIVAPGGVDPLGLRQINFDLMDRMLPGLNNVASHVRPFTVVTWAWRRARQLLERSGRTTIDASELRDFADRIEAIFAWSQFLNDRRADLPGAQALRPLLDVESYTFGGEEWEKLRDVRRYSTGLIAPINYGPALRSMYWIGLGDKPGTYRPNPELNRMLDAFEVRFATYLDHPAFGEFGSVTVARADAKLWGGRWLMSDLLPEEQSAAFEALSGARAVAERRFGVQLIQAAARQCNGTPDEDRIRFVMAGAEVSFDDSDLVKTARTWRTIQVRQVFRLALEATLRWICLRLIDGPATTGGVASSFIAETFEIGSVPSTLAAFVSQLNNADDNPVDHINKLEHSLRSEVGLTRTIAEALLFCLASAPTRADIRERADRLPLWRARQEFEMRVNEPPCVWIAHLIEVWVVAQHLYWSVGRGLADARGGGKTILRLRLTMEEGGWTLLPGASAGSRPEPTPDRLGTTISLLRECEQLP